MYSVVGLATSTSPASSPALGPCSERREPRRWRFYRAERVLCLFVAIVSTLMVWNPCHQLSLEYRADLRFAGVIEPAWPILQKLGSPGLDHSDLQWRDVMRNIPLLTAGLGLFVGLSQTARWCGGPTLQMCCRLTIGVGFLMYLHGGGAAFVLILLFLNYGMAQLHRWLPGRAFMGLVWTVQVTLLFVIDEYKDQYTVARVFGSGVLARNLGTLRWFVIFNMHTLRMISYCFDLQEATAIGVGHSKGVGSSTGVASTTSCFRSRLQEKHATNCVECGGNTEKAPCYKLRAETPHEPTRFNYGIVPYLTFMLYPPVLVAGPMLSYNAFTSYAHLPLMPSWRPLCLYAFKVMRLFISAEVFLHFYHVGAIRYELGNGRWSLIAKTLDMSDLISIGMVAMSFLYLKFAALWRFFRLFAMLDGVEPPEDMPRCAMNTKGLADFWQHWHRSFNVWIIRYMYVPLGGSRAKLWAVFPIFFFIAIWHDIKFHLVYWAGIMCCAMIVEMFIQKLFSRGYLGALATSGRFSRVLRSFGGALGICGLFIANGVGFFGQRSTTDTDMIQQKITWGPPETVVALFVMCLAGGFWAVPQREDEEWERHLKRKVLL